MTPTAASLVVLALALPTILPAQERPPVELPAHDCARDLTKVGQMEDILSNALVLGLRKDEQRVIPYLEEARADCANGDELLGRAAAEFGVDEDRLRAEVERFRHVNCGSEEASDGPLRSTPPLSPFARGVTLHVVLHEIGHGLIREFDLPVLGNEETMADAFATHVLTAHFPERAPAALLARVQSLMFEAAEVPRAEWTVAGEHDSDARRAHKIAALAVAADPSRYRPVADAAGLSDDERKDAREYGPEIHRAWRRVLQPLWMPAGMASSEARLIVDCEGSLGDELRSSGLVAELEALVRRFDWHSQVTIRFTDDAGGAGWSRKLRTVTVGSSYVLRFIEQGRALAR